MCKILPPFNLTTAGQVSTNVDPKDKTEDKKERHLAPYTSLEGCGRVSRIGVALGCPFDADLPSCNVASTLLGAQL
jgi:hypothetical protein